jgi:hypothetical protein
VYVAVSTLIIEYGRRRLFAVVDDRVGAERPEDALHEPVVHEVADEQLDVVLGHLAPRADALVERRHREQRLHADGLLPVALRHVVHDGDLGPAAGEVHRRGPAEVSVAAQHEHAFCHRQPPRDTSR